jgi:hypothetical protein
VLNRLPNYKEFEGQEKYTSLTVQELVSTKVREVYVRAQRFQREQGTKDIEKVSH